MKVSPVRPVYPTVTSQDSMAERGVRLRHRLSLYTIRTGTKQTEGSNRQRPARNTVGALLTCLRFLHFR